MFKHGRHGAIATALGIGLALLMPGSAFAGHDLVIYKAEAQVDLTADDYQTSVSCNPGDYALDGMWRIDHADQDDYVAPLALIAGAVDVTQAELINDRTYQFTFQKNAIGRAQAKIFVTCLGGKTSGDSHQHPFSTAFVDHTGAPLGPNTFDSQSQVGIPGIANPTPNVTTATATCPTGTRLVSPGFHFVNFSTGDPPAGIGRLFESISSNGLNWSWKFENSALPAGQTMDLWTTYRCLKIKVPTGPGATDHHKLVFKFKNPVTFKPPKQRVSEGQYNCGDHYKAMVAGFSIYNADGGNQSSYFQDGQGLIDPPTSSFSFNNVYYLGMDPRPKQRAYRFVNRGSVSTYPVTLRALCLNYRTT